MVTLFRQITGQSHVAPRGFTLDGCINLVNCHTGKGVLVRMANANMGMGALCRLVLFYCTCEVKHAANLSLSLRPESKWN